MEHYLEIVKKFIEKRRYLENLDVEGIFVYGSYTTGYTRPGSDIDMHILTKKGTKVLIRGSEMVDGIKVEYFEKPITDLYESADAGFLTQDNALLPIIGQGKIVFDRNGEAKKLQDYVLEKYKSPLPPLANDDCKEMAVIIENRLQKLKMMAEKNSPEFTYNYHLVIEKIRKFYHRMTGCPNIPVEKAVRIYADQKYRESFCKGKIPDEKFRTLWMKAIVCSGTPKDKLTRVTNLYNYSVRSLKVDPNNYRFPIKSRNNPLNKNH